MQCHFSYALNLFEVDFRRRWNVTYYTDPFMPALFVGIYKHDVDVINQHQGFKILMFAGEDIRNAVLLMPPYKVIATQVIADELLKYNIKADRILNIPFKSYSYYTPHMPGDKIYCYQNRDTVINRNKYVLETLNDISEYFKGKVIAGYHPHTQGEMIDIYKQCYINLQLNPLAGFTSVLEMAHMGRPSLSNYPAPFCIPYKSTDDIISLIKNYKSFEYDVNAWLYHSDSWLDINFWQ